MASPLDTAQQQAPPKAQALQQQVPQVKAPQPLYLDPRLFDYQKNGVRWFHNL